MLDKWYNLKDKQPEFVRFDEDFHGIVEQSNPILLVINDRLVIGYYIKTPLEVEKIESEDDDGFVDTEIVYDYSIAIDGNTPLIHIAQMTEENSMSTEYFGKCLTEFNIDAYWSEIDVKDVLSQIDLLRKEKQNG